LNTFYETLKKLHLCLHKEDRERTGEIEKEFGAETATPIKQCSEQHVSGMFQAGIELFK